MCVLFYVFNGFLMHGFVKRQLSSDAMAKYVVNEVGYHLYIEHVKILRYTISPTIGVHLTCEWRAVASS